MINHTVSHWLFSRSFDGLPFSGDFLGCVDLGSGRFALFVGDIAGRGIGAFPAAQALYHYVRSRVLIVERPHELLESCDIFYARAIATSSAPFASLFVAVVDCAAGRVDYASAGHDTAVSIYPDYSHRHLDPTGPLIGLGMAAARTFTCKSGFHGYNARLVVVTDGISDARPPGSENNFFGSSGVIGALRRARGADNPARAIFCAAASHAEGALSDDSSVLVHEWSQP